jgi:dihydrofolate reductase
LCRTRDRRVTRAHGEGHHYGHDSAAGPKNYQGFGSFWPTVADDEQADLRDRAFAQWLNAVEKVVFSTALQQADWHNSRIAAADPAATVRQLRKEQGGDIIVLASASIIRNLLEAGELDRLSITLCPELVGRRRPPVR